MSKGLDKQVYIYSIDTSSYYTDEENKIHMKLVKLYIIKKSISEKIKKLNDEINKSSTEQLIKRKEKLIKAKKNATNRINKLRPELISLVNKHEGIRELRDDSLKENKIIGMFESTLTRTVRMRINEVSKSLMVVRVYYYQVFKELIENGFTYNGEKYVYFSSSAGQIRTKKAVFIKESLWNTYEGALTCGLSIDEINQKGGCNVNKLLAYKALTASASIQWNDFDIDKTVVVPDLETNVTAMFDYINRDTYEITPQEMSVPIEHTDGCGMILPKKSKKSFMVRLPYVKGLLVPFAFDEFAKINNQTKITDIYGEEWDIIEDDIQVIFTSSQFKMKKYYDDWMDYKKRFKENNCQAVKLNEEDIGENANLNYQMLQTLTDISDTELKELSTDTVNDIFKLGNNKETMLRVLGATRTNKHKNHYQEALLLYPELLNDDHSKKIIKDKKRSMIRDAVSGKLEINGKYTFLIPDLYAFCERLFLNLEQPKGLLPNGEVYCNIFEEGKVDILRSPHLYKEHCLRKNIYNDERKKWFITNGIYTSIFDPISRVLQFDNDGDKALVIQNDLFVEIAERNMQGILPLYYEMGFAKAEQITDQRIYDSLLLAFKANIGEVSNNITKVFNSNNIDLRVVKWLTAENNYIIDFAKSLYMPVRPLWVDKIIKEYIKSKVPYFFIEAKDKEIHNVESINKSTVNRLRKIIPNKPIRFEKIAGIFDYKVLMSADIKSNNEIVDEYKRLERSKKWLIRGDQNKGKKDGKFYVDKYIRERLREINPDEERTVNVLVEELYGRTKTKNKTTLWDCYGDILLSNIRENLKGTKQCESCGERIEMINNQSKYCKKCADEIKKYKTRERVRKYRKCNALDIV
jgi:hypothetical protein